MQVVGYSDRLSVRPGETIRFMVSCLNDSYRADIVRLIHGDTNPDGPGFKEQPIKTGVSRNYPGRLQRIRLGSHVIVEDTPVLQCAKGFTIAAWIYPTTPQIGTQGVFTKWSRENGGYGLFVENGELSLWVSGKGKAPKKLTSGKKLRAKQWYFVAASFDAQTGKARLWQTPLSNYALEDTGALAEGVLRDRPRESATPLVMAGHWGRDEDGEETVLGHYNGKLENPRLYDRALTPDEVETLQHDAPASSFGGLVATWDFSHDPSSDAVVDASPNRLHGRAVNMPARAMTGHNWTGDHLDFAVAPEEYGAIHFHDDDLEDVGWEVDFEFAVPDTLKSGVYAAKLTTKGGEDYAVFFVRPKVGQPTCKSGIAFLAPTNTYLAYGNEQTMNIPYIREMMGPDFPGYPVHPNDRFIINNKLRCMYDKHSDGSGVCYFSRLQPVVNMRPKVNMPFFMGGKGAPHGFNADLMLLDWLEAKGYDYDVFTDEDVHFDGLPLLAQYKTVLTGSHPEYPTGPELEACQAYVDNGGRLMYLGGNGFFWVTSVAEHRPHAVEVRRPRGTAPWIAQPGEAHHSTNGEQGGHWRSRGRAPQKLLGIGFTAQGFEGNVPYKRTESSRDPRAAFIFEGVDEELLGDFPSLLLKYGAAGHEVDRVDYELGTPPHTLVVATSLPFDDSYQHVVEEVIGSNSKQGGSVEPRVRSDMVYFETPNDGAVFSVGSISYIGCLSYNDYDNNISRITENVLRRFIR